MNDLISRSALLEQYEWLKENTGTYNHAELEEHIQRIKNAPAVDAVEVVRCKECRHRGIVSKCPMCYTEDSYDEDYGCEYWDVDKTVDEGFCHCGEKWDAEVE